MRTGVAWLVVCGVTGGCALSRDQGRSGFAERLNGEHYESQVNVFGIPVTVERRQVPEIHGTVLFECGLTLFTVDEHRIVLASGSRVLAETRSNSSGRFTLAADVPDGDYTVRIEDAKLTGSQNVTVRGYHTEPVALRVQCETSSTAAAR